MTFNEFKTHMLILGWSHNLGINIDKCQRYIWKMGPHIMQVTTCHIGPPTRLMLFKNWNKSKANIEIASTKILPRDYEDALWHIGRLS